jgi:putative component of toxin-antitoxin plasmid stabilization module
MRYNKIMIEVRQTDTYSDWFVALRDRQARARIDIRIRRLSLGNPGDVLLAGGDKRTQDSDIKTALELARSA